MPEDEAVFPLRAVQGVVEEYLLDMGELTLEVLDKAGKPVGTARVPLERLVNAGLQLDDKIVVFSSKNPKKVLGELSLAVEGRFDQTSPLDEPLRRPPLGQDTTPQRAEKVPVAAQANNFGVSSFQRNEALTLTDFSNRFADWPTGGGGSAAPGGNTAASAPAAASAAAPAVAAAGGGASSSSSSSSRGKAGAAGAGAQRSSPSPAPAIAPSVKSRRGKTVSASPSAAAAAASEARSSREYDPAFYAPPED
jgi:hypothetical protein